MPLRFTLPGRTYGGYIFDLDGTLVDSMPTHYRAWRWALQQNGAPPHVFLWNEFIAHGGMAAPDIVRDLNQTYSLQMEPHHTADMKRHYYAHLLETGCLPAMCETVALVRDLQAKGIPYAIGTGSMPFGAHATLRAAGIDGLFPLMVTPEDVAPGRGKPAPDIFLLAASKMGVPPHDCVVFEDAEPGLQAAAAAGMDAVRVYPPKEARP